MGGWHPLSKTTLVNATCQALSAAYLPAKDYAGHSFRIQAATTAAMTGLEDSTIQTLGRWKCSFYQLYIRANPRQRSLCLLPCQNVTFNS